MTEAYMVFHCGLHMTRSITAYAGDDRYPAL